MSVSFNLVDQAWIPCVTPGGRVVHRGILAALCEAGSVAEVRDESPLVTISLHRLLLAVLHRVFGPKTPNEWGRLWNKGAGTFDEKKLRSYLCSPAIHPRFDLFHPTHPFYQTAALPLGTVDPKNMGRGKYVKPIWQMAHELAYSDSMNLFAHFKETDWETRPPAEAARWLVTFQGFALGGRITFASNENTKTEGSADAGQLVKSALVLVRGGNLCQTLMLNLLHYSEEDAEPFAFSTKKDKPAWEREEPVKPADRRYEGYLDLLTWQSRRVKLVPEVDAGGTLLGVSGVVAMKGWQLPGFDRFGKETMVGFVKVDKAPKGQDPWPPLGFRAGRELWRDSHALFQSVAEKSERPKVLKWIDDLRGAGLIPDRPLRFEVTGMNSNQAKIAYWRHESFVLPLVYLDVKKPDLLERLRFAVDLAEEVANSLYGAAKRTIEVRLQGDAGGKPDGDRVRNLLTSFAPQPFYWSRLELPYRRLLEALAEPNADLDGLVFDWFDNTLLRAAIDAFDRSVGQIDGGRDLKATTVGRGLLLRSLGTIRKDNHLPARSEPQEDAK